VHAIEPMGWRRSLGSIGIFLMITACAHGGASDAQSVDPASWAKTDLLVEVDGQYVYDHASECSMRDEAATSDERVLARTLATAPIDAMSRDQLIALIQRMEAVFLMSIGQGFRPTATALSMASILDCRARPSPAGTPQHELVLEVGEDGFSSTFIEHTTGMKSTHAETWGEAFRP
jgi:hypothetical protein